MTPRATRVLTLAAVGALTLAASAAWACDASKSAKATACAPKSTAAVTAKATTATPRYAPGRKAAPATAGKIAPAARKAAPAEAGMRAAIDPETGELTTLPVFSDTDPSALPRETEVVLIEQALPGGGYMIDLQGTMQEYSVMHIDAKGRRHVNCSPAPRAALKRGPVVVTPALPEE